VSDLLQRIEAELRHAPRGDWDSWSAHDAIRDQLLRECAEALRDAEKLPDALHRARESFHRIAHGDKSVRRFCEEERAAIYDALGLGDAPTEDGSDEA
jgi:hypothetical protein